MCISDSNWNNSFCCQTDADGNYNAAGLPAGSYYVEANGWGNFDGEWKQIYTREYYNEAAESSHADLVAVSVGQDTPNIDFTLEQGAIMSGQVTDSAGQPIQGVCISAVVGDSCQWDWAGGSQSDENGNYAFVVPTGAYYIRANPSCNALNYVLEWWNGAAGSTDCSQAVAVNAIAGQETGGIDFQLDPGGSITGKVTRQDNSQAIADAQVCISNNDWTNSFCYQTDADGNYNAAGLPADSYYVEANGWGNFDGVWKQIYTREYYNEAAELSNADLVAVSVGQDTPNINFTLEQGATISGTVYKSDGATPITEGGWVNVYSGDPCGSRIHVQWGSINTSDGTYSIDAIPAGTYYLEAYPSGLYLAEWWTETLSVVECSNAQPIIVAAGDTVTGKNFQLDPGASHNGNRIPERRDHPRHRWWMGLCVFRRSM